VAAIAALILPAGGIHHNVHRIQTPVLSYGASSAR
jgi:hypothetical protein